MADSRAERVLGHLHQLLRSSTTPAADGWLLERFVAQRDEDAFAELVARHGPLVFGLCRRLLGNVQDAEDVFQATFLVLARKAATIRKPESLSCFLHGVAYRLAIKTRAESERRRHHEQHANRPTESEDADVSWREVRGLIDEELQRLPEKQRLPLLLCYLEGLTQDEAARRLGWPRGTLKRRLEAGRERLRIRLTQRGVTLGAGLFAVALTESAARGAVSAILRCATVRAGMQFTTVETAAIAATRAALLAKGALQTMLATKLKLGAMFVLLLGCVTTAAGLATLPEPAAKPAENKPEASAPPRAAEVKQVRKDRYGDPLPKGAIARLGTVRLRHQNLTSSAVFTRDGKTAIVGDHDGSIVYWDVATGREVRRLTSRQKIARGIFALAITRDGKTLASGSWGEVCLWDVASGKLLSQTDLNNSDAIGQILFTPDGKTLALHSHRDTLYLWDVVGKKKLHDLKGHRGNMACMALSPDGKTLASGSWQDQYIRLWDITTGKEKLHFAADNKDVLALAYSPDGKTLAVIANSGFFAFFDANTGKRLHKVKGNFGVNGITYAPDGKTLIGLGTGGDSWGVHILDAASGKLLRKFDAPPGQAHGLTISPDGKIIATFGGIEHTFDLWNVANGKLLHPVPGHRANITSLVFSADGRQVFSTSEISDGTLQVWDARTGERWDELSDKPNNVNGLALSPDGKLLAVCKYKDCMIHLWDPMNRKEVRVFKGHTRIIDSVAWSADGKTLASVSRQDGSLRIWDAATGKQRRLIDAKQTWVAPAVLSPDGKIVAAGGHQGSTIRLWSADTGKELQSIKMSQQVVFALSLSPDGSTLAGGYLKMIGLWEPATGRLLRQWDTKTSWTSALAFARDGHTLISGHDDGSVHLWDVVMGKERACFKGHHGAVRAVAISRDSRSIASGSNDTTILVWDATGGARPDAILSAEQLQALWRDLMDADAGRAYRAMWQMALSPKQALPFLTERLHPITSLDAAQQKQLDRFLADLDSEQFTVRQQAEADLEKMGPAIEPALRKTLENKPSLEVRQRIEKVLDKLASERLRILRALESLEHMNTPQARRLLESLAAIRKRG